MRARLIIICVVGALMISCGFIASGVFTYAWATDIPKSFAHDVIRAFYMPQALSAALALDAIGPSRNTFSVWIYALWFFATLPASLIYMLIVLGGIRLFHRPQSGAAKPGR
jgi:hypothetical protein